ncbi:hypothetical protein [Roseobacter sp.]|uniref:hypothetical protein n=1 Tax=Roseobacter sp. TaxID=1907202 RepID=UPI0038597F75
MSSDLTNPEFERDFALAEYKEIGTTIRHYISLVTATERFAIAGAAAFASFSISGLTEGIERAQIYVSFIPFAIVSLAGLRCLTLYFVISSSVEHLKQVETELLESNALGFNRLDGAHPLLRRAIELTSGAFWVFACSASIAFWLLVNDIV